MLIIARGAEALVKKGGKLIVKERIIKGYRIKQIDEALRKKRTKLEARVIREARRAGVLTPQILEENEFSIKMEFINGIRVKEFVEEDNFEAVAEEIGKSIALLQNYDIIHGDLTTSNMIIARSERHLVSSKPKIKNKPDFALYFIDFGLGFFSRRIEDKATDLHLLKEVITATHFQIADKFWSAILSAYSNNYDDSEKVIKALQKIEKRGRYVKRGIE